MGLHARWPVAAPPILIHCKDLRPVRRDLNKVKPHRPPVEADFRVCAKLCGDFAWQFYWPGGAPLEEFRPCQTIIFEESHHVMRVSPGRKQIATPFCGHTIGRLSTNLKERACEALPPKGVSEL